MGISEELGDDARLGDDLVEGAVGVTEGGDGASLRGVIVRQSYA